MIKKRPSSGNIVDVANSGRKDRNKDYHSKTQWGNLEPHIKEVYQNAKTSKEKRQIVDMLIVESGPHKYTANASSPVFQDTFMVIHSCSYTIQFKLHTPVRNIHSCSIKCESN